MEVQALQQYLQIPRKVVIIPHVKPDADALGSCLAWKIYLQKKGHIATVISPSEYPAFLKWMPQADSVLDLEFHPQTLIVETLQQAELLCFLDFNGINRMEQLSKLVSALTCKKMVADHHIGKEDNFDFEFWYVEAAATCEIIYDLIIALRDEHLIDTSIGECLYAGIMTDTGSFKYATTTSKIHRIVANLIEKGVNTEKIHRNIFDNNSLEKLKFLGYALHTKLVVNVPKQYAYFYITRQELLDFHTQVGDTEGLVNYALSIKGVSVAALFKEDKDGSIKISLRSIGDINVRNLSAKYFNGGGHKNAAGGKVEGKTLDEVRFLFENVVSEFVNP
ncbi:MAG: bifunctional oligoribonuclease/PAP phosphatase NrnA [Cytophagales bacterium]|nr:bifunctional oligoribonuclease/PAP phosphatase NrnA [Cytophagales bacterium]MDW8385262.1 bifunctional oligoribonuclease/PAP phosphatase NrnA [Flammeovirgaceae bacterium]